MPLKQTDSWETHLAAAVVGTVAAQLLRHRDVPPRVVYAWELHDDGAPVPPPAFDAEPEPPARG
jgi:hypothetical protein